MLFFGIPGIFTAQTLLFQSGFEPQTDIEECITTSTASFDVTGEDNSLTTKSDWEEDIPAYTDNLGEYKIQTELESNNNCDHMSATLTTDPDDGSNQVMKFEIKEHSGYPNSSGKGRVQGNVYFDASQLSTDGLTNMHFRSRLYIPKDFEWMLATSGDEYEEEYDWMTLVEFFNLEGDFQPYPGLSFRISLNLHKNAGESVFRLTLKGEPREEEDDCAEWKEPIWYHVSDLTIGAVSNTQSDFNLNQWLTLDVYYIEGDASSGKVVIKINDKTALNVTDFTHHPDEASPDGIKHFNPHKLYTSGAVVDAFNAATVSGIPNPTLHVLWDDFAIWRDFNPHDEGITSPETEAETEYSFDCTSIGASGDDGVENSSGTVTLNGTALDLHDHHIGLQFSGITIPAGAMITGAYLKFTTESVGNNNDAMVNIYGESSLSPDAFDDQSANDLSDRIGSSTFSEGVEWRLDEWDIADESDCEQESPDISELLTSMLFTSGEDGIASTDVLSFILEPDAGNGSTGQDGERTAHSYNSSATYAPQLCISYHHGGCYIIAASDRDAEEEESNGLVETDDDDLDLHDKYVGLQFSDITIPPHATITKAYIQFKATHDGNSPVSVKIHGERFINGNNPASFVSTDPGDGDPPYWTISDRTSGSSQTTVGEVVSWDIPHWDGGAHGFNERTPDLSAMVQEMMGTMADKQIEPDDVLSFIFEPISGTGMRAAYNWDAQFNGEVEAEAPTLCIEYNYEVSGNIRYYCEGGFPMPDEDVEIRADANGDGTFAEDPCDLDGDNNTTEIIGDYDAMTDVLGNYRQELCDTDADYLITPVKDDLTMCGVTTLDLIFISMHVLENTALSPIKRIAADAHSPQPPNETSSITNLDLRAVRGSILGKYAQLPWDFHDGSEFNNPPAWARPAYNPTRTISVPGQSRDADFLAIQIGDVNCSCTEDQLEGFLEPDVKLLLRDQSASKNDTIDVVFQVEGFADIMGYQAGIYFESRFAGVHRQIGGRYLQSRRIRPFGLTEQSSGNIRNCLAVQRCFRPQPYGSGYHPGRQRIAVRHAI